MARDTTLGELVTMVREEAGRSTSAVYGQNTLSSIQRMIKRTYERLHADWAWPHLRVVRDKTMAAGSRHYAFPTDLDPDRIESVVTRETSTDKWRPVAYGIDPLVHYNSLDPSQNERQDPVRAWELYEGGQFEVWPLPNSNTPVVRFTGLTRPVQLTQDTHRCDLDDNLIVLYVTAQLLARQKAPDAELKLEEAAALYQRLKGNSQRSSAFRTNQPRNAQSFSIKVRAPGT